MESQKKAVLFSEWKAKPADFDVFIIDSIISYKIYSYADIAVGGGLGIRCS
jgi:hypothetical protein